MDAVQGPASTRAAGDLTSVSVAPCCVKAVNRAERGRLNCMRSHGSLVRPHRLAAA